VIRAIFTNNANLINVASKLDVADFTYKPFRIIYNAIKRLAASATVINGDSIMAFLESRAPGNYKEMVEIGGAAWIDALYDSTYEGIVNLDEHIQAILTASFNRKLYDTAVQMYNLSQTPDDVDTKLELANQYMYNLMLSTVKQKDTPNIGHDIDGLIEQLKSGDESVYGIDISKYRPKLNAFLKRLQPGKTIIFNANAKAGKSTLMWDIAWVLAGQMGIPVAIADTELNRDEVQLRLLSKLTGYRQDDLRNPEFVQNFHTIIERAAQYIKQVPIYRFDASTMSNQEVETKVKLLQIQKGIKAFIWDHPKEDEAEGRLDKKIGQKILTLKNRIANDCGIWTCAPMQRNENTGRVADSYEPYRLADAVITFEEVDDGIATHKLTVELSRYMPKGTSMFLKIDLDKQQVIEV
jgi:replicative DNA helicase